MKTLHLLCACTVFSMTGFGQEPPPPRQGQFAGQMRMQPPYDASKEETIKAKVADVKEQTRGSMTLVSLVIDLDGKECQVVLGPTEFLKEKNITFAKDDEITIKGVKDETPQGLRIRAREVRKDDQTLTLLDAEGRPVRGGRPQRPQGPGGPPPPPPQR
ncbi:MAG: hypothetical protein LBB40_00455 [Holophagales bacterium]|jgi:hypothetical protein|nr:hypothetical protein [Holophagales bacterium]